MYKDYNCKATHSTTTKQHCVYKSDEFKPSFDTTQVLYDPTFERRQLHQ